MAEVIIIIGGTCLLGIGIKLSIDQYNKLKEYEDKLLNNKLTNVNKLTDVDKLTDITQDDKIINVKDILLNNITIFHNKTKYTSPTYINIGGNSKTPIMIPIGGGEPYEEKDELVQFSNLKDSFNNNINLKPDYVTINDQFTYNSLKFVQSFNKSAQYLDENYGYKTIPLVSSKNLEVKIKTTNEIKFIGKIQKKYFIGKTKEWTVKQMSKSKTKTFPFMLCLFGTSGIIGGIVSYYEQKNNK